MRKTLQATWYYRGLSPAKTFPNQQAITLLVMGSDENRDDKKRISTKITRSDTIMLARFNFVTQKVSILSIPRDTWVDIPGHGKHKINAAHAIGGSELVMATLRDWVGVTSDQWVSINYRGFKQAVDALGGIKINVDKQLDYDDNWGDLHVHLKPGDQVLDGDQALGFVRIRKCDSDFGRIERQQQFMHALKLKLADPVTYAKAPDVLNAIMDNVRSDMDYGQMLSLANWSRSLPASSITMKTVPAEPCGNAVCADDDQLRAIIAELFLN
ncbi:MAG: LCP family protein [Armatimonadota bacterium]